MKQDKRISIRIPKEALAGLLVLAGDMKLSAIIRMAIFEFLRRKSRVK
jgi:hypothetical protein